MTGRSRTAHVTGPCAAPPGPAPPAVEARRGAQPGGGSDMAGGRHGQARREDRRGRRHRRSNSCHPLWTCSLDEQATARRQPRCTPSTNRVHRENRTSAGLVCVGTGHLGQVRDGRASQASPLSRRLSGIAHRSRGPTGDLGSAPDVRPALAASRRRTPHPVVRVRPVSGGWRQGTGDGHDAPPGDAAQAPLQRPIAHPAQPPAAEEGLYHEDPRGQQHGDVPTRGAPEP